jgi:hypothetical protein
MALDWDGLAYTADAGYRTPASVTGTGFAYTPWMKENAPDISRQGLYWGSHNRAAGDYTFTTFGDHHALPRVALPDLFFSLDNPFRTLTGENAPATGRGVVGAYAGAMLTDAARVLVAIQGGATGSDEISSASGVGGATLRSLLSLLERIGYVERTPGGYALRVVVLNDDARPAAERVVSLVREAMDLWHKRRVPEVERDLAALTALEQGVPFAVLYSEIWHYIFGYTNRYLAEAGLITDPYARSAQFRGFVPVLWATAIAPSS